MGPKGPWLVLLAIGKGPSVVPLQGGMGWLWTRRSRGAPGSGEDAGFSSMVWRHQATGARVLPGLPRRLAGSRHWCCCHPSPWGLVTSRSRVRTARGLSLPHSPSPGTCPTSDGRRVLSPHRAVGDTFPVRWLGSHVGSSRQRLLTGLFTSRSPCPPGS